MARQGKWADAREKFKNVEFAVTSLPLELQRVVITEAMRASIEVKDYSGAASRSNDLDVIGIPADLKPALAVLRGRLAEALGRDKDALAEYKAAAQSADRAVGDGSEAARHRAAPEARRNHPGRRAARSRDAVGDVARRRARGESAADDGADLFRHRPLRRIAQRRAHRDQIAAQFGNLAGRAGRLRGAVRATVPQSEGRRSSAGRCAGAVLRIQRVDADRAARRRNDPPPGGSSGGGRPARSGQRTAAIPGRSPARGRGARAGRREAGDGVPDEPQAGSRHRRAAHHAHRRSRRRIAAATAAAGGARAKRHRPPRSRPRHHLQHRRAARRSGCAPTSIGRRGAGANPPNRSNCITATAGAISNRSTRWRRAT